MPAGADTHSEGNGQNAPEQRRILGLAVKWWILISVSTASFIGGLDGSIVSVTLPVILSVGNSPCHLRISAIARSHSLVRRNCSVERP